jgi:hypothetical protein
VSEINGRFYNVICYWEVYTLMYLFDIGLYWPHLASIVTCSPNLTLLFPNKMLLTVQEYTRIRHIQREFCKRGTGTVDRRRSAVAMQQLTCALRPAVVPNAGPVTVNSAQWET